MDVQPHEVFTTNDYTQFAGKGDRRGSLSPGDDDNDVSEEPVEKRHLSDAIHSLAAHHPIAASPVKNEPQQQLKRARVEIPPEVVQAHLQSPSAMAGGSISPAVTYSALYGAGGGMSADAAELPSEEYALGPTASTENILSFISTPR
jgi:hypothetical protein